MRNVGDVVHNCHVLTSSQFKFRFIVLAENNVTTFSTQEYFFKKQMHGLVMSYAITNSLGSK